MPLVRQLGQLAQHGGRGVDRGVVAVEGHHVAAQEDVAVDVLVERAEDRVAVAAERRRGVVGDLDLAPHRRASDTSALTRLPSARPATFGIAAFMTAPMSLGDVAPDSATAASTIARSSSSESSAGR